jgi:hypothetical protein
MKRSAPLIILVGLTLAALSYGGKRVDGPYSSSERAPAALPAGEFSSAEAIKKPVVRTGVKATQGSVVIADFAPLEIEEIH